MQCVPKKSLYTVKQVEEGFLLHNGEESIVVDSKEELSQEFTYVNKTKTRRKRSESEIAAFEEVYQQSWVSNEDDQYITRTLEISKVKY
ncbi:hypothetical protein V7128_01470 [Neobacillus vireti]|uniref:hypothetical protein n=1 Tax=Neobacillus vireti TaxID=220686 RepID=UPI002FFFE203